MRCNLFIKLFYDNVSINPKLNNHCLDILIKNLYVINNIFNYVELYPYYLFVIVNKYAEWRKKYYGSMLKEKMTICYIITMVNKLQ